MCTQCPNGRAKLKALPATLAANLMSHTPVFCAHLWGRVLMVVLMLHWNCIMGCQHAGTHLLSILGFSSHMSHTVLLRGAP